MDCVQTRTSFVGIQIVIYFSLLMFAIHLVTVCLLQLLPASKQGSFTVEMKWNIVMDRRPEWFILTNVLCGSQFQDNDDGQLRIFSDVVHWFGWGYCSTLTGKGIDIYVDIYIIYLLSTCPIRTNRKKIEASKEKF